MVKKYPRRVIACAAVLLLLIVIIVWAHATPSALSIAFLDVGQGDAVLITAPNGNRLLYDAGPGTRAVLPALSKELSYFDRRIPFMIASHPDSDHIGGFVDVLQRYTPLVFLDGHTLSGSAEFAALDDLLTSAHIERRTLQSGSQLSLGAGVLIEVLGPTQDARKEELSSNDSSVVLLVQYGSSKILLTGDLESKEEARLVATYGSRLHATILKAGHHGSKSSSSETFLAAVAPKYVVISAGKNNKFGHPHEAALARIRATHAEIVSTLGGGSIHFSCSLAACMLLK